MRITAGEFGSRTLKVPDTDIRPTQDRVREAVFSSLGDLVIDARILDLYAGTGSYGLEALSRGAASAHFVEKNLKTTKILRENIEMLGLEASRTAIHQQDVATFLGGRSAFYDLIFIDPPTNMLKRASWKRPCTSCRRLL